jgi:hypothetical protein
LQTISSPQGTFQLRPPLLRPNLTVRSALGAAPIERVVCGVLVALESVDEQVDDAVRRRIRIAAAVPGMRARMIESNQATEDAIVEAPVADGANEFVVAEGAGILVSSHHLDEVAPARIVSASCTRE